MYNGTEEEVAMATVSKRLLTPQEYLEIERRAETKSEFYAGEMFAMSGASWEHTLIKDNIARRAGNQLNGGPCKALTSDLRVRIPTGLYTYPDVVIVCDEPKFEDAMFDTLLNPRCLVEVLSESTEGYDRGTKFSHYRQIPSLKEFILVSQEHALVERFVRQADESWLLTEFKGLDQTFAYATIPVKIPLAEIYAGVTLPDIPLRDDVRRN
jgi:Uma2 family endonuclease